MFYIKCGNNSNFSKNNVFITQVWKITDVKLFLNEFTPNFTKISSRYLNLFLRVQIKEFDYKKNQIFTFLNYWLIKMIISKSIIFNSSKKFFILWIFV